MTSKSRVLHLVRSGDDEVFVNGRLVIVMSIDLRVRHVALVVDGELLVGDSSRVPKDPDITCSTCGAPGHRCDRCFAVVRPKLKPAPRPKPVQESKLAARWSFLREEERQRLAKKRAYMARLRANQRAARAATESA